jgi:Rieske Fe-S protein
MRQRQRSTRGAGLHRQHLDPFQPNPIYPMPPPPPSQKTRTDGEIAEANGVALSELRDPQTDSERVIDPKVGLIWGLGVLFWEGGGPEKDSGCRSGWGTEEPGLPPSTRPLHPLRPHPLNPSTLAPFQPSPTQYLVVVGICTHLGCVPIAGAGEYNGWFCPCHGRWAFRRVHYSCMKRANK